MPRSTLFRLATAVAFMLFAGVSANAATESNKLGVQVRTQLQSAMQMHIERTTTDGIYPKVDLATGQVRKLVPTVAHPMVLRLGEHYVLCVNFRDEAGQPVNVDFYLASALKGFSVFQVEIANRLPLESLVKAGVARMAE